MIFNIINVIINTITTAATTTQKIKDNNSSSTNKNNCITFYTTKPNHSISSQRISKELPIKTYIGKVLVQPNVTSFDCKLSQCYTIFHSFSNIGCQAKSGEK
jgi:hypothetical protein